MSDLPQDLFYTKEHEWVRFDGDNATIGITDYAQNELGDVVYVELPDVGASIRMMEPMGTIESVKSVSDLFAPVSGAITAINARLESHPETVNQDPYQTGWMLKVKVEDVEKAKASLLSAGAYAERIA